MTPSPGHTVAIVGGGAVGAALFDVLVDRLSADAALKNKTRLVLIEKSERVGPGLAYAKDDARYILNQSAQTMSLVAGRRGHFCEWLEERGVAVAEEHFCSRRLFGDYVEEQYVRALEKARRRGIAAATIRDEVASLAPRRGGYRVQAARSIDCDIVVLALGNLPSTRFRELHEHPGYVASPYPAAAMCAKVARGARVAILGSGLTAIDAALALCAEGHAVTMASRSGLLPAIRGPLPQHELRYVTRANVAHATDGGRLPLRWPDVARWIELELAHAGAATDLARDFPEHAEPIAYYEAQIAAAKRGPRAWQAIGEALNPMIEVVWHHLAADDKRLFLDRFYSRFMSHWVPIPIPNGEAILSLLRSGKLTVKRGLERVDRGFELHFADRVEPYDVVVNATGIPRDVAELESPLLRSLLRQRVLSAHDLGGVRVDFESQRALGADGRPDPSLYLLGNLTSGTHFFTSTLERNVEKADRIAAQIVTELSRRRGQVHADLTPHST